MNFTINVAKNSLKSKTEGVDRFKLILRMNLTHITHIHTHTYTLQMIYMNLKEVLTTNNRFPVLSSHVLEGSMIHTIDHWFKKK